MNHSSISAKRVTIASGAMSVGLAAAIAATAAAENRSMTGMGNNLLHPDWGMASSALLRLGPNGYGDQISSLGGMNRPNPRDVSNIIVQQPHPFTNNRRLSDWVWQWGQFMDHDLTLVLAEDPAEPVAIPVPPNDPIFLFRFISFNRSAYQPGSGTDPDHCRLQVDSNTSYLDGSAVYGSDDVTAASLREFAGGRLLVTKHPTGDLLPMDNTGFFFAGDVRVDEQLGLVTIQTLWVREHNYWAQQIAAANPSWNDEQIYQRARKMVIAEIEAITFNEWLPALLGASNVPAYAGYNPNVNATVANEFASALFRVGHTMLSPTLLRVDNDGTTIPQGNIALRDAFFVPQHILKDGGIDPHLKGLASQAMQEIDAHVVEDVRSFLFTLPTGGMDLPSLNLQRGRDHGLGDYNSVRVAYGLPAVKSFSEITSDEDLASKLQSTYGNVNDIDPWIGGLAEDHVPGGSVGPLIMASILDQFTRARAGDRMWYQNDPELADQLSMINSTTLAQIIERNSKITNLQANVFFIPPHAGDVTGDLHVNVHDLLAVIDAWGACPQPCPEHCAADIAPDGGDCAVNVNDLLMVIDNWGT